MKNYIQYDRLCEFYRQNASRLETTYAIISENTETGRSVCLTKTNNGPEVVVFEDGKKISVSFPNGCDHIDQVALRMCTQYLIEPEDEPDPEPEPEQEPAEPTTNNFFGDLYDDPDDDDDIPDYSEVEEDCHDFLELRNASPDYIDRVFEVVLDRRDEINNAFDDLLYALMGPGYRSDKDSEVILKALEVQTLHYLASEHGISVWAPVVDETEYGEVVEPYPYDEYLPEAAQTESAS